MKGSKTEIMQTRGPKVGAGPGKEQSLHIPANARAVGGLLYLKHCYLGPGV